MATSLTLYRYEGYPTDTSMRVYVTMTVRYSGKYKVHFEVIDDYGDTVYSGFGSTFSMSAGESITKADDFYKTFTGLESGTWYQVTASLYNADKNTELGVTDSLSFTTTSPAVLTVNFYDGSSYDVYTTEDYIDLYAGSLSGWTFVGWATSTGTTSVAYEAGDRIYVGSSSSSINLYAVYKRETTIYCYYINGNTGATASNSRIKIQYRVNVSKTSYSTGYYNSIVLPAFDSINSTISTSTPVRDWTAIGWNQTTTAEAPDYSPSQSVSSNQITGNLYAIYRNECSITFNSNGGSGTMSTLGPTYAYYNASGNYTTPSFSLPSCTFTPPTGKKFDSWNQKADGSGATYSSSLSTNYVITLYAIWVKARPSNWSWPSHTADKPISSGSSMNYIKSGTTVTPTPLTAAEWLAFMNRIKEFYAYDNGKTVNSTYWNNAVNGVKSGSPMTATQVNSARYLISQLPIQTTLPSAVSSGGKITAAFINGLKNSLNSIP